MGNSGADAGSRLASTRRVLLLVCRLALLFMVLLLLASMASGSDNVVIQPSPAKRYLVLLGALLLGVALTTFALVPGFAPPGSRLGRSAVASRTIPFSGILLVLMVYSAAEYLELHAGESVLLLIPPVLLGIVVVPLSTTLRAALFALALGVVLFFRTEHLLLLLGLGSMGAGAITVLFRGIQTFLSGRQRPEGARRAGSIGRRLTMCWGAIAATLVLCEAVLLVLRAADLVQIGGILPKEYEVRRVDGGQDYYWHGVFHRFNKDGFRGEDFPDRGGVREQRFRIVVLGDSLTYGYGVEERQTYSERLRRLLSEHGRVSVFNLGVSGAQSEDIVRIAREYLPRLEPDLVLYGHCMNDFLPAGMGEYSRYTMPLPSRLKQMVRRRTLVGGLLYNGYSKLLIDLGLQNDFFDDILKDIGNYDRRFARDMRTLNELVVKQTNRAVLSLVLNQYPRTERGRMVARLAEKRMREAGMTVIPADPYEDEYAQSGVQLNVSIWEGHPNALAHSIFAGEFERAILSNSSLVEDLERHRAAAPAPRAAALEASPGPRSTIRASGTSPRAAGAGEGER